MTSERALVDTNVLVFAMDPEDERHAACYALLERTAAPDSGLCVAPRVLAEFYRVVTDPKKVPKARTVEEALDALSVFLSRPGLEVLPVPTDLVLRWMDLVRRHGTRGRRLFDVILIATMLANDVRRIYTYNRDDFTPFDELEVLTPTIDAL
jgi:toxin-antitoxin system PIN domain toxin